MRCETLYLLGYSFFPSHSLPLSPPFLSFAYLTIITVRSSHVFSFGTSHTTHHQLSQHPSTEKESKKKTFQHQHEHQQEQKLWRYMLASIYVDYVWKANEFACFPLSLSVPSAFNAHFIRCKQEFHLSHSRSSDNLFVRAFYTCFRLHVLSACVLNGSHSIATLLLSHSLSLSLSSFHSRCTKWKRLT